MGENPTPPIPDWLDVSRETVEVLSRFAAMVQHWTKRINLISVSTSPEIWVRHVLDSAQLFELAGQGTTWADLGSGGGFPGIVLAIIAQDRSPGLRFDLVESDQRKAAFLRKVATELGLNCHVHALRSESLPELRADTVSARALAPLELLLPEVKRHMSEAGRAILPKGARADEEVDRASRDWHFDLTRVPSRTNPNAQILVIENLHHA